LFQHINLASILVTYVAVLFALSVHEAAHATASYMLGDDTAARMGRMTLNPLAHIDPIGTFLLPLLGMISGIRVLGWAKPVPVNTSRLSRKYTARVGYAMVAAAGPISNLIQSLVFLLMLCVVIRVAVPVDPQSRFNVFQLAMEMPVDWFVTKGLGTGTALALSLLGKLVIINVGLAIFNLLPFGPLDGAGILRGFLPYPWLVTFDRIQPTITIVLLICFLVIPSVISFILGPFFFVVLDLCLNPLARLVLGA
jgi:Zn-dependent protease